MARKTRWVAWVLAFAMIFQVNVTAFADGLPDNAAPAAETTQNLPGDGQEQTQPVDTGNTEKKEESSSQDTPLIGDGSSSNGASNILDNPASSQPPEGSGETSTSTAEPTPQPPVEGELPKDDSSSTSQPPTGGEPPKDNSSSTPADPTQPTTPGEQLPPETSLPPVAPVPPVVVKPDISTLEGEELLLALQELSDEEFAEAINALTKTQLESIIPLMTDEDEQRISQFFKDDSGIPFNPDKLDYYPATDLEIGSIVLPSMLPKMAMRMLRNVVAAEETMIEPPDGVTLTKTASVVGGTEQEPIYQVNLKVESKSHIIGTAIPCDIALVLDRSGSMDDYGFILNSEPLQSRKYAFEEDGKLREIWYDTDRQSWVTWRLLVIIPYIDEVDIAGKTLYTKRIDVLKDSVNLFVDSVASSSSNSKIAVVSYASDARVDINLTEMSKADDIKNAVGKLTPRGATATDEGMQKVHDEVFKTAPDPNRARVVIMFTDGVPTTGSSFSDSVATRTKTTAADLKSAQHGCTIYTVGVFDKDTVNGDLKTKVDKFMTDVATPAIPATPTTPAKNYYLSADTIDSLNDIFTVISSETGTVIREIVVKDFLDPRFVYYQPTSNPAASVLDDCLTWSNITVEPGADKAFTASFQIKRKPGYIGGYDIPTNKPGKSAIYETNGNNIGSFPLPVVDVPIIFETNDVTDYILYGETAPRVKEQVEESIYSFVDVPEYKYPSGMFTYSWNKDYHSQPTEVDTYQVTVICKPSESKPSVAHTARYTIRPIKPTFKGSEHPIFLGESIKEGTGHSAVKDFITMELPSIDVSGATYPSGAIDAAHQESYFGNLTLETSLDTSLRPTDDTMYPFTAKFGTTIVANEIPVNVKVLSGSLSITKQGAVDNQSFVFKIEQTNADKKVLNTFYCVIDGNGTATVNGLPKGTYVVTEDTDWSWRYKIKSANSVPLTIGNKSSDDMYVTEKAVTMVNEKIKFNWFSSSNHVTNRFIAEGGNKS